MINFESVVESLVALGGLDSGFKFESTTGFMVPTAAHFLLIKHFLVEVY